LLEAVGDRLSGRKIRLFAVACCRTMSHRLNPVQYNALWVAERHADQQASDEELRVATQGLIDHELGFRKEIDDPGVGELTRAIHVALYSEASAELYLPGDRIGTIPGLTPYSKQAFAAPWSYALMTSIWMAQAMAAWVEPIDTDAGPNGRAYEERLDRAFALHAEILRDIAGNPFHDTPRSVTELGRQHPNLRLYAAWIYLHSAFHRVPKLASLIVDAGLKSSLVHEELKAEPRGVKGHWLVDSALGLE
jgi:hypothetical protein